MAVGWGPIDGADGLGAGGDAGDLNRGRRRRLTHERDRIGEGVLQRAAELRKTNRQNSANQQGKADRIFGCRGGRVPPHRLAMKRVNPFRRMTIAPS